MPGGSAVADSHADVVVMPLGLFHDDHILDQRRRLRRGSAVGRRSIWLVYADAIYRRLPDLRRAAR